MAFGMAAKNAGLKPVRRYCRRSITEAIRSELEANSSTSRLPRINRAIPIKQVIAAFGSSKPSASCPSGRKNRQKPSPLSSRLVRCQPDVIHFLCLQKTGTIVWICVCEMLFDEINKEGEVVWNETSRKK